MRPDKPRPVHSDDRVAQFDCGNEALNTWLVTRAMRNEMAGDSRTYVSVDLDSGDVAGYYSLAAWSIAHDDVGAGWLPRTAPDPISVILLGRLAVALPARGIGLGCALVVDAARNARAGARVLGARALVAEAIDDQAALFYQGLGLWQFKARHDRFAMRLA